MRDYYRNSRIIWSYVRSVLYNYYVALFFNHNFWYCLKTNVEGSIAHIPYSWIHSKCYIDVEEYLKCGSEDKTRHKWHGADKIAMFILFPWLGPDCINNIHQLIQDHHPCYWYENEQFCKPWWKVDWKQAVIDWECARFTKEDKPLDAYDTLLKYYGEPKNYFSSAIHAMEDLGLYQQKYTDIGLTCSKTGVMDSFLDCYPKWKSIIKQS